MLSTWPSIHVLGTASVSGKLLPCDPHHQQGLNHYSALSLTLPCPKSEEIVLPSFLCFFFCFRPLLVCDGSRALQVCSSLAIAANKEADPLGDCMISRAIDWFLHLQVQNKKLQKSGKIRTMYFFLISGETQICWREQRCVFAESLHTTTAKKMPKFGKNVILGGIWVTFWIPRPKNP